MATKHTSAGQGWQGITHHPLFATVVPVWLAATFALSTLAIRGELIERIVLSAQLDLILPMATPPLGTTARLLLAVAFGLVGALLGWAAVRMLAPRRAFSQTAWQQARQDTYNEPGNEPGTNSGRGGKRESGRESGRESAPLRRRSADAHPDFPARQPIQAHAELGAHGFDNEPGEHPAAQAPASGPQMTETAVGPSYAPPPPVAETWQVLHDVPAPPPPAEEPSWDWKPQQTTGKTVIEAPFETSIEEAQPAPTEAPKAEAVVQAPVAHPFRFFKIDPSPVEPVAESISAFDAPMATPRAWAEMAVAETAVAEVAVAERAVVRAAPEIMAAPAEIKPAEITQVAAAPVAAAKTCAGFPSLTLEGPSAAEHIASASLESLSHVELLERLALALQRHQHSPQEIKTTTCEPALAPAPDGTGDALRAALASLRDVK